MIIRSQDKRKIVNLDNIDCIHADGNIIIAFNGDSPTQIGEYSSLEKAIKVLDMICEAFGKMKSCDCNLMGIAEKLGSLPQNIIDEYANISKKLYVFQMPQDSEV